MASASGITSGDGRLHELVAEGSKRNVVCHEASESVGVEVRWPEHAALTLGDYRRPSAAAPIPEPSPSVGNGGTSDNTTEPKTMIVLGVLALTLSYYIRSTRFAGRGGGHF